MYSVFYIRILTIIIYVGFHFAHHLAWHLNLAKQIHSQTIPRCRFYCNNVYCVSLVCDSFILCLPSWGSSLFSWNANGCLLPVGTRVFEQTEARQLSSGQPNQITVNIFQFPKNLIPSSRNANEQYFNIKCFSVNY